MQGLEERIKQARQGDARVREELILENMPLVWSMVKRFTYTNRDKEELFQIGMIGLMQAIDRFDPAYEVQFSTYAVPLILGEIRRFLRDDTPVKINRSIIENRKKIRMLMEEKEEWTLADLAKEADLSIEEVMLALESEKPVESIYQPVYDSGDSQIYLLDQLEQKEKPVEQQVVEKEMLSHAIACLEERERQIIVLRFFENKTQTEVGRLLDMTQVQVSRMEKKILLKMRSGWKNAL